jgi:cell fate (sporulation/competence/biofilm development) regulator YlbF (YheA/YmcA/DUF963 family)
MDRIAMFGGSFMKDDFGYFGSGLEGYVQYMEAYKRISDNASAQSSIPEWDDADMEAEEEDCPEEDPDTDSEDDFTQL